MLLTISTALKFSMCCGLCAAHSCAVGSVRLTAVLWALCASQLCCGLYAPHSWAVGSVSQLCCGLCTPHSWAVGSVRLTAVIWALCAGCRACACHPGGARKRLRVQYPARQVYSVVNDVNPASIELPCNVMEPLSHYGDGHCDGHVAGLVVEVTDNVY